MYNEQNVPEDNFISSFREEESIKTREKDDAYYYLQEISRTPLLTKEREKELCQLFEDGKERLTFLFDSLPSAILERVPKFKRSSLMEITPLLEQIENACKSTAQHPDLWEQINKEVKYLENIRSQIVEANLRLVASLAKKYIIESSSLAFLDLMQEGSIGLMIAVEKYDLKRGYRFSTYSTWWILQRIKRALDQQGKTIRTPCYAKDAIRTITKIRYQLAQELEREPTIQEISAKTELTEKRVIEMINSAKGTVSLNLPIDEYSENDSDRSYSDILVDEMQMTPEEETFENSAKESIENLLRKLNGREALVIKLRYGVADGDECTLNEIGDRLSISRERIRQIEKDALVKLKRLTSGTTLHDLF